MVTTIRREAVVEGASVNHTTLVLLEKDAIKLGQDTIKKSLVKLDQLIHNNAVQCLLHAEKHGDTSLMRRLLVDVIDAKSGYRRQGLINWMRKHSPMELKGDTINLSGTLPGGEKRPFLIEEANTTPFFNDRDNAERVMKPVYQDTVVSKMDAIIRELGTLDNTSPDGKPIDPTKPFYDGIHLDKMRAFRDTLGELKSSLPADGTREVRQAQAVIARVEEQQKAA